MKIRKYINYQLLVFLFAISFSSISFSRVSDEIVKLKVDFIIETINSTSILANSSPAYFQIGIIGKGSEIRKIANQLEKNFANTRIQKKPVKILIFSRLKSVENVDFIILSGDTKIRPSELSETIGNTEYILLTEDLPFGLTPINYSITADNKLIYEIQEKQLKNNGISVNRKYLNGKNRIYDEHSWLVELGEAQRIIKSQVKTINQKKSLIKSNVEKIGQNKKVINKQIKALDSKDSTINSQQNWLILAITSIIIISSLSLLLLRANRLRKKATVEIQQKNKEIFESLNYAKNIQIAILPKAKEISNVFEHHFILYEPKEVVSGDFYWLENNLGLSFFAVADCTGHGVPGALMSVICSQLLTKIVKEYQLTSPAKILDRAVLELAIHFSKSEVIVNDGMDLSLICIDKKADKMYFSGANNLAHYFSNGVLHTLKADKQPVGAYNHRKPYTQQEVSLSSVDSVYLFTDGYQDQFGGDKNKKFSRKRLRSLLIDVQEREINDQQNRLAETLDAWKQNEEQVDDICVAGIVFKHKKKES